LAFNSKKSDGFNPYFACFDEFAAWEGARGMDMYNVMLSAQGARHDPINIACSTANFVDAGLYDELFARSTAVLNGTSEEKALLPFLYMIDDPEKWDNIHELKKSLPNLGVSFYEKNLRAEINKAHASPNYKGEFITKYCNLKQNTSIAWLKEEWIKGSQCEPLDPTDFYGMACVGGVDLSQTTDLTAAAVVISFDGKDYILCHFWMPTERVAELSDRDNIDYMSMVSNGHLSLSGGKYVDYHDVTNWFLELRNKWKINVLVIGYDRYSAQYFVDEMRSYGYLMDDVLQGTNLTPMIYEFEGLIADGKIKTGTNGLLHLHMRSSALQRPAADKRVRLVKTNQRKHIDGMAATIDALTVRNKYANKYSWLLNANRRREVGE
jgi:phage terminase large subunit-like protein